MGNRGVLHNEKQEIIKPFQLKRWIICVLEFKGRKREVMSKNRYTELFFWDEASAYTAGHRPCAECQRPRYKEFMTAWQNANHEVTTTALDDFLHSERLSKDELCLSVEALPNGVFVEYNDKPYLFYKQEIYEWSFGGYAKAQSLPNVKSIKVLTPNSIVKTFSSGFEPWIVWDRPNI